VYISFCADLLVCVHKRRTAKDGKRVAARGRRERESVCQRGVSAREKERSEIEAASARSAPRGLIFKSPLF